MDVSLSFLKDLKLIDKHLSVAWINSIERFVINWTDPRTKVMKCVLLIEEDDGGYRHPDRRALLYASQTVSWDTLYKYPDMDELWKKMQERKRARLISKHKNKEDYRRWWNKEHRKEWRAVLENARRGIFSVQKDRERKIIIA